MTRADFYSLKTSDSESRYRLLLTLLEKSHKQGSKVHIQCRDDAEADHLDTYIWGIKPETFLPHHVVESTHSNAQTAISSPITLGYGDLQAPHQDICINLDTKPVGNFARIIEIIVQDETILSQTRRHYREYKDRGAQMHHHQL